MPYRDEDEVLRERYRTLEGELSHLKESREILAGLDAREAQLRDEMAALTRSIARSRRRTTPGAGDSRPLLANLSVASPCPARWEDMMGDERTRFCGGCKKDVHNISALDADEAEALLKAKAGDLCVRYYQRADGTVMTQDCPDGLRRRKSRKLAVLAAGAFGLTATAFGSLVAFAPTLGEPMQGDVTGGAMVAMGTPPPTLPTTQASATQVDDVPPPPPEPPPAPQLMGRVAPHPKP